MISRTLAGVVPISSGDLLGGRLAADVLHQRAAHADQLVDLLHHVHRHADGPGLVGDGAGDALADPPGGVGRELEAAAVVELLDGADQAQVALLDQVEERDRGPRVALGDRDDEAQVGLGQSPLGIHVLALDALGQRDLLGGREQLHLADLPQVETDGVGGGRRL